MKDDEQIIGEPFWVDDFVPLANAGKTVSCLRCGATCRVADFKNQNARPFQNADGDGFCPDCVMTQFLKADLDVSEILPEGSDIREVLRAKHIQENFVRMLQVGHSDVKANEINWERVIANWDLPLRMSKKRRKK